MLSVVPLAGIGEVVPGDSLPQLLVAAAKQAAIEPRAFDVLVVTQKIVSKAENRFVDLRQVTPSPRALELADVTRKDPRLVEVVLSESSEVVRAAPNVLITRHRTGHVMANAGVDRSNLDGRYNDEVLLLPENPDESAERIRAGLQDRSPEPFGVVISDSFGRPWREGVVNVAIGAAGLPAIIDRRGELDRAGRPLEVTVAAFADMIAAAAGLVTGDAAEGIPAALVRGLSWSKPAGHAADLIRPVAMDLFR